MKNYYTYSYNYKRLLDKVLLINNCSEFIFLSESEFEKFKTNPDFCSAENIKKLKEKFFIVDEVNKKYADEIIETKRLTKHSYLTNDALLLMVVPTLNCNCNCIYCQVTSQIGYKESNNLSFNNIVKFCDFVFALPHKDIKIEFQGGEPLLAFDTIQFIVKRINFLNRRKQKTIVYVICSNLMALNEKEVKFIKKYEIQVSTSIDGPQDYHNKNRPSPFYNSSFEVTKTNITLLRNAGIYPSALVTVTNNNIQRMKDIVDTYIKLGFTGLFLRPLNNYGLAYKNVSIKYTNQEFMKNYKETINYIISKNVEGITIKEEYFVILLRKIYSAFNDGFVDMQNPCALGLMCMIVDQHGDVYPCDEARMISEMGDKEWKMGNIQEADCLIQIAKMQKRIHDEGNINEKKNCENCVYKTLCFADPIREWYINKYSHDDYCGIRLEMFDFVFEKILNATAEEQEIFWKWAND